MRVQSIGDYYTLQGAAEALGVSYWQVWRAIHQRQIPTLTLGQTLLVRLADLRPPSPPPAPAASQSLLAKLTAMRAALEAPTAPAFRIRGQVCPECGSATLVYEEGCQKCLACGYSVC